jgi:hypothetical protein
VPGTTVHNRPSPDRRAGERRGAGSPPGEVLLAGPAIGILGLVVVVAGRLAGHRSPSIDGSFVDAFLPVAIAASVAVVVGWARPRRRRHSRPRPVLRPVLGVLATTVPFELAGGALLVHSGAWPVPLSHALVSWTVTASFLAAVGAVVAAVTRRGLAGVAVVVALAAFEEIIEGPIEHWPWGPPLFLFLTSRFPADTTDWLANREIVGLLAVAGFAVLWGILRAPDRGRQDRRR